MLTEKQRSTRLRRHMDLKRSYEVQLGNAATDAEKSHLEARIAEIDSQIEATELLTPKELLPKITKTAEEEASLSDSRDFLEANTNEQKMLGPKREHKKTRKVGNPF